MTFVRKSEMLGEIHDKSDKQLQIFLDGKSGLVANYCSLPEPTATYAYVQLCPLFITVLFFFTTPQYPN